MKRPALGLVLVFACAALAACLGDDVCDPGEHEYRGACYADKKAPSKKDAGGDEDDAGANGTDAAKAPSYAHFGDTCKTDTECKDPAPTCLGPLGYCSRTQCGDEPDACPPDWTCTDVSAASPDPNVTHVCIAP